MLRRLWVVAPAVLALTLAACEEEPDQAQTSETPPAAAVAPAGEESMGEEPAAEESMGEESMGEESMGEGSITDESMGEDTGAGMPTYEEETGTSPNQ